MKNTRKISIALVIVMVLMMALAVIPASAADQPATLYLTPNANWKTDGARFAAYFFGNGETWVSMTDSNGDGIYEVAVPTDKVYPNVIFCRMNPGAAANNWDNKWNQTSDLTIPTSGANHYTVKEGTWDKGGGTWSTFGSTCAHANLGDAATCTTAQVCNDCGDPVVSALGHSFNTAHLCTRCDEQASFTVAGDGAHLGNEWNPANTANDMTYADGVYTKVYTNVAAGTYMFKVARDHDWGTAYPSDNKSFTVATAGSTVTITLKGTTVDVKVEAPHVHSYFYPCDPVCQDCFELSNPDAKHTVVHVDAKAATCYENGNVEYWYCSDCGTAWTDEAQTQQTNMMSVVLPMAHAEATHVEAKAATCTENGNIEYWLCEACGQAWLDEACTRNTNVLAVVLAASHNFADGKCSACGEADPDAEAPSNDHTFTSDLVSVPGADKDVLPEGTKFDNGYFTIVGKVTVRWSESKGVYAIELDKKSSGAVEFVVTGNATVVVSFASTGGSNLSLIGLVDAAGNAVAPTEGVEEVTGTSFITVTYNVGEGTYKVVNPSSERNTRVNSVVVSPAAGAPECEHNWVDATCTAPKTCSACGETEGEALGHSYYYNLCLVCYEANPHFENNFTTVGDNKLVCNEYHLVDTDSHLKPYQFTLTTIPEDGHYIFTADSTALGVFIYTIPYDASDVDGWAVGGPNWSAVTFGEADLEAGTYYLGFIFYNGVGEYDLTITKAPEHEHNFVDGECECGESDPNYVPPHEHEFVEGKCECGAEDPDYVAPEQPADDVEPELNFFQKIWKAIVEFFQRLFAMFKK